MPTYEVKVKCGNSEQSRLVQAANQAQAIRHVAEHHFALSVPTTERLFELAHEGVKLERAST